MESVREVRLGDRGDGVAESVLNDGGCCEEGGMEVRVCRYEVRRWELWIWRGSSWRMSW